MIKAFVFAILFVLAGFIVFALLAPLLFHNADFRKLGALSAPVIVLVFGSIGFIIGWRLRKKR